VDRRLLVIVLTLVVNLIGFGIMIPLLPLYVQSFGASEQVIGMVIATFSLSQLVASPALGALSDRWGRRPVLMASLVGTAVSFVMLALARSIPWLFAARMVDGFSGGNISTARAYVADITSEADRARAYGLIGAAFGVGFVLGPALGGALAHVSYTAPIWAAAAMTVAATMLAWMWLPETVHRGTATAGPFWAGLREAFSRRALRPLLIVDFVYWTATAVFQGTFALVAADRFGFDVPHVGYVLAAFGVVGVIVQVRLVGPAVAALGERRVFALGLVLAVVGLGAAALAHDVRLFLATLVPFAVGSALCTPSLASLISRSAGAEEQGTVQGAASALESLGRTIGPVSGTVVLQRLGDGAAFGSGALLLAATIVLLVAGPATIGRESRRAAA
jgi:DHA1 family tetracycline resistance protein-like MFS transporter